MGLDVGEIQDVFIAALLHDIGRFGFSESLLDKPVSGLSGENLPAYRQHPADGAKVIARIAGLELFDGTGFPDGLSGLNIPPAARIIGAVSDYEVLKSGVLTMQALSAKASCMYLIEAAGSRYDPRVIEVLEPILALDGKFEVDELPMVVNPLHEGMTLSRDVLHPKGFVLLSRGCRMNQRLIEQLAAVEQQTGTSLKVHVLRDDQPSLPPLQVKAG